jgi:hypothetical protein
MIFRQLGNQRFRLFFNNRFSGGFMAVAGALLDEVLLFNLIWSGVAQRGSGFLSRLGPAAAML